MKLSPSKSTTLLELLIAIVLFSIVVLSFTAIDTFSRSHVIEAERRSKIQNEAYLVLEHMRKMIAMVVGNTQLAGQYPIRFESSAQENKLIIDIDTSGDGKWEDGVDKEVSYTWDKVDATVYYCGDCSAGGVCNIPADLLSSHIKDCGWSFAGNYIQMSVTACWDPQGACGGSGNPKVQLLSRVNIPAISLN